MERYDLSRLDVAIRYTQRIAAGRNPVTNKPATEEDSLNNPNIERCMTFIGEVLQSVRNNNGMIGSRGRSNAEKEAFPFDQMKTFVYGGDTTITRIVRQMNEGIDKEKYNAFSVQMVTKWLEAQGLVDTHPNGSEKQHTTPTDSGRKIGIYTEQREYNGTHYEAVVYGKQVQKLIFEHAEEIMGK